MSTVDSNLKAKEMCQFLDIEVVTTDGESDLEESGDLEGRCNCP
jgi:hypothetical protein